MGKVKVEDHDPDTGEVFDDDAVSPVEAVGKRLVFRTSIASYARKLFARGQDLLGREIPDEVPVAPPLGYIRQPSMVEHMREMVRSELLRREALSAGFESFDEADDFDVPDEDPLEFSGYEYEAVFEPPVPDRPVRPEDDSPKPAEPAPAPAPSPAPSVASAST